MDLKLAKYKIDKLTLNIEGYGEFEVDPVYISSIMMEKDYDNYNFPYFELAVGLPIKIYRAMKKENIKNTCYIRIKYAYFPVDLNALHADKDGKEFKPKEKNYMAKNFFIYGVEGTPNIVEDAEEAIEKELKIEKSPGDLNNMVTTYLLLYDEAMLQRVTKVFNEVITDCTLTDAVTRVLNLAGFSNVLMSPANNGRNYHEFTLLPLRVDAQLTHICNDFHMHTTGTRIFFDFEYTYIVSKSLKCDAWRPREYKKTYVIYDPPTLRAQRTQGCCEDPDDECNYCTMCNFSLTNPSYMEEQVYGLSYTHLDSKTGSITNVNSDAETVKGGKPSASRIIYNNSGESSTTQQMQSNIENTTAIWEVLIDSTIIDFLTPNKEFEFVFLSSKMSKYNGRYKIMRFTMNFDKSDGEWYLPVTRAFFAGKKTF